MPPKGKADTAGYQQLKKDLSPRLRENSISSTGRRPICGTTA